MSFQLLKSILIEHNVYPGKDGDLTFEEFTALTEEVRKRLGDKDLAYVLDMFMPHGDPVEPGYEDSCSYYWFEVESWEELETSYNLA